MSEAITALGGAHYTDGIADVTEVPLQGMITLRGELSDKALKAVITSNFGVSLLEPGHVIFGKDVDLAWMSPDELLLLVPYARVSSQLAELTKALAGTHALAVNVSDARASFRVSGPFAREVLAKLCPVDLAHAAFTEGMFRRTRMAQVPAALWLAAEDTLQIICFRSQAQYVFDVLKAAAQPGSEVGYLG